MNRAPMWRRYLRFLRADLPGDVDDELRFHLEMRAQELVEQGMTPDAAQVEALRQFGDLREVRRELVQMDGRHDNRARWRERLEASASGVRYAFRRMRRSPGFAAAVVLTFALGLGANAVMFTIVDRLLLSPPAHVRAPERVQQLMVERFIESSGSWRSFPEFSYPDLTDFESAGSFAVAAVSGRLRLTVGRGQDAHEVYGQLASGGFFSVLDAPPAVGRFFGPADDAVGAEGTAVVSHAFWQRAFAGDPAIVGRTLDFGYGPYTVVGVAPRGFNGTDLRPIDLWLPLIPARGDLREGFSWMDDRSSYNYHLIARLSAGITSARMQAEATVLHRQGRAEQIQRGGYDGRARILSEPLDPAGRAGAGGAAKVAAWLLGISVLVLLIACANVANLLLARTIRDRREIGIRGALGASRGRVVGLIVTETFLLAGAGGLGALAITHWGGQAIRLVLLPDVFWPGVPLGGRVLVLVLVLALMAGLAAGVMPALQAGRANVAEVIKTGSSRADKRGYLRTHGALTALQAMLSVVLLVAAGLFVRSLQRVEALDLGFDPDGVLLASPVFQPGFPVERRRAFYREASDRLRSVPGVEAASSDVSIPFWSMTNYQLRVPGLDSLPALPDGALHVVEPGYFDLLRLRMRRGRPLRSGDTQAMVVNETMARLLWPGQQAIGKCILIIQDEAREPPCATVVGVVENARANRLVEDESVHYYLAVGQQIVDRDPEGLLVRARGNPAEHIPAIRQALLEIDPGVRFAQIQELRDLIEPQSQSWRIGATMFSLFGLLALLVSGVGLYSILAFGVAQRRFELGVRAALGAAPERLLRLVVSEAMRVVAIGVAAGLAISVALSTRLEPMLFEVSPRDPLVLGGVVLALVLTALAAAWVPSRRATRVDPARALRSD